MKNEKWWIFIYPAYVICFMGIISVFLEVFKNIQTPAYIKEIYLFSAEYLIIFYFVYLTYNTIKIWKLK